MEWIDQYLTQWNEFGVYPGVKYCDVFLYVPLVRAGVWFNGLSAPLASSLYVIGEFDRLLHWE